MAKAPRFASREEYEAWKRERSGGAAPTPAPMGAPEVKCSTCGAPLPHELAVCAVCRPDPIEAAAYDGGDSGLELMERPPRRQTVLPPLEEEPAALAPARRPGTRVSAPSRPRRSRRRSAQRSAPAASRRC